MLDPLSALAVAAACVQFVDFVWKVVTKNGPIFNKSNTTAKKDELARVVEHLKELVEGLKSRPDDAASHNAGLLKISEACERIGNELAGTLTPLVRKTRADIAGHGTTRKWLSAGHALRSKLEPGRVAELEREVQNLRHDLVLVVLVELTGKLGGTQRRGNDPENTAQSSQDTPKEPIGQSFLESIDDTQLWQRDLIDALLNNEVLIPTDTCNCDGRTLEYFLENLKYPGMFGRFKQVQKAYDETFKWIYTEERSKPWDNFQDWLEADDSKIYWVSGKPGSGKSTLMKFVASHDQTEICLKRWAQTPSALVCASFYFWSGGSFFQTSQEGMLRSLLYQIFEKDVNLMGQYCPRRAQVHQLFGSYSLPWTLDELRVAFTDVLQDEEKRFFLLIDGLDECKEDHEELIGLIQDSTEARNVKITEKSHGVFLWVRFVVHAVLDGLKNGLTIPSLQKQLEKLPTDLEDLFRELLSMVEDSHKADAYKIFSLIKEAHAPINLLTLSFAHEDYSKPVTDFAIAMLSIKEKEGRCNMIKRRLMSHCKGLLEVVPASRNGTDELEDLLTDDVNQSDTKERNTGEQRRLIEALATCKVQYMHRTVKDFLAEEKNWDSFSSVIALNPFDPSAALSQASLIHLRTIGFEAMTTRKFWGAVQDTLQYASKSKDPLVNVLDELDHTADHIARTPWPREPIGTLLERHIGIPHPNQRVPGTVQVQQAQRSHGSAAQATGGSRHSFLCLAVQYSLVSYVQAKLESGASIVQHKRSRSLLDCAIRDHNAISILPQAPSVGYPQRVAMIKLLLDHGDDPNRVHNDFRETPWMVLAAQILKQYTTNGPPRPRQHSRVFLARSPKKTSNSHISIATEKAEFWLSTAEMMVKHNANCRALDVKAITEVLGKYDEGRAGLLKKSMERRRSLSFIWTSFTRRKTDPTVMGVSSLEDNAGYITGIPIGTDSG